MQANVIVCVRFAGGVRVDISAQTRTNDLIRGYPDTHNHKQIDLYHTDEFPRNRVRVYRPQDECVFVRSNSFIL